MKIGDFAITQRAEELDAAISLIVPMLHEQTAAWPEPALCARSDLPDAGEPVLASDQAQARFEAHIASFQMSVSRGDVRRIRRDQVERLRSERIEPVAENKVDFSPVGARVAAGGSQSRLGNIRGVDPKTEALPRESDGHRSSAGSQLLHSPPRAASEELA